MSICLVIDDVVKFNVKGTFTDRNGKDQAFSFTLECDRVDTDTIEDHLAQGGKFLDFFTQHTRTWSGVLSADKSVVPFSADAIKQLFALPGVPLLTWRRYLEEIAAKSKN